MTKLRVLWRKAESFWNLALPIRWAYALNQRLYAMACEIEACDHYEDPHPSSVALQWIGVKGFFGGMAKRAIPEWFIDRWFEPVTVHAGR